MIVTTPGDCLEVKNIFDFEIKEDTLVLCDWNDKKALWEIIQAEFPP